MEEQSHLFGILGVIFGLGGLFVFFTFLIIQNYYRDLDCCPGLKALWFNGPIYFGTAGLAASSIYRRKIRIMIGSGE